LRAASVGNNLHHGPTFEREFDPDQILSANICCWAQRVDAAPPRRHCRRAIAHRLEKAGYVTIRNSEAKDGMWVIGGKRQNIYVKDSLSAKEGLKAARRLVRGA
jgi:hypothetical protein